MTEISNEGAKKHFLLTIARANQCTSIIRAILFSTSTDHVLFRHLYGIVYIALAVDLGKLFDKSSLNIDRFLKLNKTIIPRSEYEEITIKFLEIKNKHKKTINSIVYARHNMGAHLNIEEANRIYENPYTEENVLQAHDIKMLLDDIINLLNSLSILDDDDRTIIRERIGPKDVMDTIGLNMDPEKANELLKIIQNNQFDKLRKS